MWNRAHFQTHASLTDGEREFYLPRFTNRGGTILLSHFFSFPREKFPLSFKFHTVRVRITHRYCSGPYRYVGRASCVFKTFARIREKICAHGEGGRDVTFVSLAHLSHATWNIAQNSLGGAVNFVSKISIFFFSSRRECARVKLQRARA